MRALCLALVGVGLSAVAAPSFAADEAACKTMWETADVNKDGSLDATEGPKHMEAIKTSGAAFDADSDGKLTTAEFTEACKADTFKDIKWLPFQRLLKSPRRTFSPGASICYCHQAGELALIMSLAEGMTRPWRGL